VVGLNRPPSHLLPKIRQRLTQFDTSDRNAVLRAEALNTLEAFTYRARDYLEDETFIAASSESTRKALEKLLARTSDWLYGDGAEAKVQELKDRLKSLQSLVDPVLKRRDEANKRPDAVKALKDGLESLNSMVNMVQGSIQKAAEDAASSASSVASSAASSVTASSASSSPVAEGDDLDDDPYSSSSAPEAVEKEELPPFKPYEYTTDDLSLLTTKYEAVKAWLEEKMALQDQLGPSEDPAFLVSELETKRQELQKVVSETVLKTIKMQDIPRKPKPSKKAKAKGKKSKSSSETASKATASPSSTSSSASASSSKSVKDEL